MGLQMGDAKGVYMPRFGIVPQTDSAYSCFHCICLFCFPHHFRGDIGMCLLSGRLGFNIPPLSMIPIPLLSMSLLTPPSYGQLQEGGYCPPLNELNAQYYLGQQLLALVQSECIVDSMIVIPGGHIEVSGIQLSSYIYLLDWEFWSCTSCYGPFLVG